MAWTGTPTWTIETTQGTPNFTVRVISQNFSFSGSPLVKSKGDTVNVRQGSITWNGTPTWTIN